MTLDESRVCFSSWIFFVLVAKNTHKVEGFGKKNIFYLLVKCYRILIFHMLPMSVRTRSSSVQISLSYMYAFSSLYQWILFADTDNFLISLLTAYSMKQNRFWIYIVENVGPSKCKLNQYDNIEMVQLYQYLPTFSMCFCVFCFLCCSTAVSANKKNCNFSVNHLLFSHF